MCSFFGSITNSAAGEAFMFLMPPSDFSIFSISRVSSRASFLVRSSNRPSSRAFSSWSRRSIDFLTVIQLVSVPPSQRLFT